MSETTIKSKPSKAFQSFVDKLPTRDPLKGTTMNNPLYSAMDKMERLFKSQAQEIERLEGQRDELIRASTHVYEQFEHFISPDPLDYSDKNQKEALRNMQYALYLHSSPK